MDYDNDTNDDYADISDDIIEEVIQNSQRCRKKYQYNFINLLRPMVQRQPSKTILKKFYY
mgnify:CR=1 FL=1